MFEFTPASFSCSNNFNLPLGSLGTKDQSLVDVTPEALIASELSNIKRVFLLLSNAFSSKTPFGNQIKWRSKREGIFWLSRPDSIVVLYEFK